MSTTVVEANAFNSEEVEDIEANRMAAISRSDQTHWGGS